MHPSDGSHGHASVEDVQLARRVQRHVVGVDACIGREDAVGVAVRAVVVLSADQPADRAAREIDPLHAVVAPVEESAVTVEEQDARLDEACIRG